LAILSSSDVNGVIKSDNTLVNTGQWRGKLILIHRGMYSDRL